MALAILVLAPIGFGLLSLALGQDANWDLRNYHWYNAYAFLHGRLGFDLVPAQTPSFYNPTLDVPFYLAASHLPTRLVGWLVGAIQGLNFVLVFLLGAALLRTGPALAKVGACAGIALVGMLGGGGLAQLGTTFYDNVVSLGVLGSALAVAARPQALIAGPGWRALLRAALVGLPVGIGMGLKQPTVIYCVGLCLAVLVLPAHPGRRLALAVAFGLGILAGVAAFSGHWMWTLWRAYDNPLFPYYNNIFHSPYAEPWEYRDTNFVPGSLVERLLLPLYFAFDPLKVGEVFWRDLRIPVLFAGLPLALVVRGVARRRARAAGQPEEPIAEPVGTRYLLAAVVLSYAMWVVMFCIYRYLIPLEMLAPLAIALAIGLLPLSRRARLATIAAVLAIIQATVYPADWERVRWGPQWVSVGLPRIPDPDHTMVLMGGYWAIAHVVPAFLPQIPFVRIQSNFSHADRPPTAYDALMRERVAAHSGPFFMLSTIPDTKGAAEAAQSYGLRLDWGDCQVIATNLGEPLNFCAVRR